jgi:hypothetical protein
MVTNILIKRTRKMGASFDKNHCTLLRLGQENESFLAPANGFGMTSVKFLLQRFNELWSIFRRRQRNGTTTPPKPWENEINKSIAVNANKPTLHR